MHSYQNNTGKPNQKLNFTKISENNTNFLMYIKIKKLRKQKTETLKIEFNFVQSYVTT